MNLLREFPPDSTDFSIKSGRYKDIQIMQCPLITSNEPNYNKAARSHAHIIRVHMMAIGVDELVALLISVSRIGRMKVLII
jgi:hypothetical protein